MSVFPRFVLLIALIFALVSATLTASAQPDAQARVIMFYSPTCPHCREVLENVLPPLQAAYGEQLEIQLYDLSESFGYQVYAALHERYPQLPTSVPQVYIDQYVLVGSVEVREELPPLIDACLARGGCDWPFTVETPSATSQPSTPTNADPVYLAYCFDPACLECDRVTYDLNYLQSRYPNLVVRQFNIRDDAALIEAMCERYGVPPEARLIAPAIFIGESYLALDEITMPRLRALVETAGDAAGLPPWAGVDDAALESATARIMGRFGGFSVLAVAVAGLLDGVNPCAFTTIIFFISYLALLGRERRDILLVGAAFTAAVFLTYLAMGLGLSALIERLGSVSAIGRIIYLGTAIVCAALAILSLLDYVKIRRGRMTDITLQLPRALKRRIHQTIRTHSRMRGYMAAAFGAGVLVSVFELACTGQVYLPTIVFMTGVAEMRLSAIAYLVLYNLLFIVPLIVVFGVAYFGVSSQRLTAAFQTHAGGVKLFTALLFALLAGWLVYLLLA